MVSPRTKRNLRSQLRRSTLAKIGIVVFVVVVLVAVFAPFVAPHDPTNQHLDQKLIPPVGFTKMTTQTSTQMVNGTLKVVTERTLVEATWTYPLGTDPLGRGMFSRLVYGARTSILVGLLGTLIAMAAGVPVGLTAGYFGDRVDDTLMRIADVMLAFPSLVLAIALVGLIGRAAVPIPDPWVALGIAGAGMPASFVLPGTVILVVGLVRWVWFARVARGEALSIGTEEYVKAARSAGASHRWILRKHVLPNALTPILVLGTLQVAAMIILSTSLAFLGFSGTTLSWGYDIAQGRDYLATSWWVATLPGLAIVVTVVSINLIGDWLRDALDPGIEGEGGAG
ncbi:MAG: ABC transporter permease [Halanaeroarchaeum sp.]